MPRPAREMPSVGRMRTAHDQRIRDALWQLTAVRAGDSLTSVPPLLFLKTPAIACLWMASLLTVVGLSFLGRIQVPRIAKGTVVAVRAESGDTTLVLLLPASARAHVRPGQRAEISTGTAALQLSVTSIDSALLDATTARSRLLDTTSLIGQLNSPKLVVHLSNCGPRGCLTPMPGTTFAATTLAGTRSLANYALSGS